MRYFVAALGVLLMVGCAPAKDTNDVIIDAEGTGFVPVSSPSMQTELIDVTLTPSPIETLAFIYVHDRSCPDWHPCYFLLINFSGEFFAWEGWTEQPVKPTGRIRLSE